ncbi:MAG TPA: GNAT family N-acetyltransferase [Firmicutes bacterium]|jgi:GNAT superfamily N-acetyltransferase|nr:GNAT family N-acetyltransferase [Bacillota bacterium]
MIRQATISDLKPIMKIVAKVCQEMRQQGNEQWDENYPREIDFGDDIQKEDLYVDETDGQVRGFICINYFEPPEYGQIHWSGSQKPMIIHRMAIASEFRKQGIGSGLLQFAEQLAQNNGIQYLRSDTNSANRKMNALFGKTGYTFVGEMPAFGKKSLFNFYDKLLVGNGVKMDEVKGLKDA